MMLLLTQQRNTCLQFSPIVAQCSISVPPENVRKPKGYRNGKLE